MPNLSASPRPSVSAATEYKLALCVYTLWSLRRTAMQVSRLRCGHGFRFQQGRWECPLTAGNPAELILFAPGAVNTANLRAAQDIFQQRFFAVFHQWERSVLERIHSRRHCRHVCLARHALGCVSTSSGGRYGVQGSDEWLRRERRSFRGCRRKPDKLKRNESVSQRSSRMVFQRRVGRSHFLSECLGRHKAGIKTTGTELQSAAPSPFRRSITDITARSSFTRGKETSGVSRPQQ